MKKTKLTRSLLAAFSIVALTAVVYGCDSGPSQSELDAEADRADQAQMQVNMLQQQINALRTQLGLEADDDLGDNIADLQQQVDDLEQQIEDAAEAARMAQEEADRKAAEAAAAAMAATAAKLYAGISAPSGAIDTTAATARFAGYNDAGEPTAGTAADTLIRVNIGDGTAANVANLSEDKMAMVADNHGWAGKKYADPAGGDMYEAVVYSNVEEPTMGDKFGQVGVGTPVTGYEYGLSAAGQLAVDTTTATNEGLVGGTNFDHSAGVKRFPLPSPNPGQATVVNVSGTFHGVSGTYSCTPGAAVCAANVTADGFDLGTVVSATDATFTDGGGAWMFKPSNPEARVMDSADVDYASYGWWIKKAENDGPFTASAFVDVKGTVADAAGLNDLNGTATYMGGAAGKYALASSTGGTNDAGHFTARATLEANFTNNTAATAITGTLDMFMGADGMARDWEVALKGSAIGDTGAIGNDGTSTTSPGGTVWTLGGTAAAGSGQWSGNLRNNGADGVPQVATGTFYSEYGTAGKMVGAFGANKE